jgi:4-hydroxybenzoate polyprenyltransferase/phosphoserine phosphatase
MSPAQAVEPSTVPLCVDLDGTVIKTDLLWESMVQLLRRNPFYLFAVLAWWTRGRAFLKAQIARRARVEMSSLPCHEPFLEFLRTQRQRGRRVILVTASDAELAKAFGKRLALFDEIMASNGKENLRGSTKAARLVERFGKAGFDYAGNSSVDIPVWREARHSLVVNASASVEARARQLGNVDLVFPSPRPGWRGWLALIRPHQWVKNLILFVPLVTSHKIGHWDLLANATFAFCAFCFGASAIYVLNDLLDVESDRHHATKSQRPFASGALPLQAGLALFPVLAVVGLLLSLLLPAGFVAVLLGYLVAATFYSSHFKQAPLLDVFVLAGLYTLRLVAGHEATGVAYSVWLLAFSMFIFLSLALVKRFIELNTAREQGRLNIKGRGYQPDDLALVSSLGATSGYISALVLALYVNSADVRELYHHPALLLLICPLMLFWISRVWLVAHRGQMHEDPIAFALCDRVSYLVGFLILVVVYLATGT